MCACEGGGCGCGVYVCNTMKVVMESVVKYYTLEEFVDGRLCTQ